MRYAVMTDTGGVRNMNQDCVLAYSDDEYALFAVADGMGGHRAGEVASALAARELARHIRLDVDAACAVDGLDAVIGNVNRCVYEKAVSRPEYHGMGTTLTMALLRRGKLHLGHIGDSRAYLLRAGRLRQITYDHSYTAELVRLGRLTKEQARTHPGRNIITRALGVEPHVETDVDCAALQKGDLYLICSDGLTNMIDDEHIKAVLDGEGSLYEKAARLVRDANDNGGYDNISVVLFEPGWEEEP